MKILGGVGKSNPNPPAYLPSANPIVKTVFTTDIVARLPVRLVSRLSTAPNRGDDG